MPTKSGLSAGTGRWYRKKERNVKTPCPSPRALTSLPPGRGLVLLPEHVVEDLLGLARDLVGQLLELGLGALGHFVHALLKGVGVGEGSIEAAIGEETIEKAAVQARPL